MARPRAEMRRKIILPTVYSNQELCQLEESRPWIFKSWAGTLSCSDDHGRFAWNPWRMARLVWAGNAERIAGYEQDLDLLVEKGLIHRYGPNREFGCFPKFEEHNSLNKPTPSEYPDPFPSALPNPEKNKTEGKGNRTLTVGKLGINPGITPEPSPVQSVSTQQTPARPAQPKKLGFDPHEINEPVGDYTAAQVKTIVRYHWDESENSWWRDNTRSREFFERNIEKMAKAIPASWLNPKKVVKKTFMHPTPRPQG